MTSLGSSGKKETVFDFIVKNKNFIVEVLHINAAIYYARPDFLFQSPAEREAERESALNSRPKRLERGLENYLASGLTKPPSNINVEKLNDVGEFLKWFDSALIRRIFYPLQLLLIDDTAHADHKAKMDFLLNRVWVCAELYFDEKENSDSTIQDKLDYLNKTITDPCMHGGGVKKVKKISKNKNKKQRNTKKTKQYGKIRRTIRVIRKSVKNK